MEAASVRRIDEVPPRSRTRRGRGAKSRDAVLAAVRDLLRERRIDELMVNEIVQRAGISRPTFYAQFDTKYSVVAALVEDVGEGILDVWEPLFGGSGPIDEATLLQVSSATVERWREHGSLFTATIEGWHTDTEIHDAWSGILDRFSERLIARIRRADDTDLDPELLAGLLIVMFERAIYMASSAPTSVFGRSPTELSAGLARMWFVALSTRVPPLT